MPLIRMSDEAYHEIKDIIDKGLSRRLVGFGVNTIARTASELIKSAVRAERELASMTSSKL